MKQIKKYLFSNLKKYFNEEIDEEIDYLQNKKNKIYFDNFFKYFNNENMNFLEKDIIFKKNLARKYGNYLFLDTITSCLSSNVAMDIYSDFKKLLTFTNKQIDLTSDTIFITHPWSAGNLTGNTNAYRGVVYNGFIHDENNVKGFYIENIDIAYINNGNHSVSIGSIMNDINIKTNNNIKSCYFNKDFFESKIEYNSITLINGETINIHNWKFAVFLKMVQYVYQEE